MTLTPTVHQVIADTAGIFLLSATFGGSLWWGLKTGRMPAWGAMIDRDQDRSGFQFRVWYYGSVTALLLICALGLAIRDLLK